MAGRDSNSEYHSVSGSGKKSYDITINYGQGHWCNCRGMISKKSRWGDDAGKTQGTSCKHIVNIINMKYNGDWGRKNSDGSRSPKTVVISPLPAPPPTGRRAAIMATRAKREAVRVESTSSGSSLLERIASLEAAKSGASD